MPAADRQQRFRLTEHLVNQQTLTQVSGSTISRYCYPPAQATRQAISIEPWLDIFSASEQDSVTAADALRDDFAGGRGRQCQGDPSNAHYRLLVSLGEAAGPIAKFAPFLFGVGRNQNQRQPAHRGNGLET